MTILLFELPKAIIWRRRVAASPFTPGLWQWLTTFLSRPDNHILQLPTITYLQYDRLCISRLDGRCDGW